MEELFSQKIDTENGKSPKKNGPEFQSGNGVAENGDRERLQIDKEPFASEIGGVKKFEVFAFESVDGVDTIGGLIGVESGRDSFDVVDSDGEGENEDDNENSPRRDVVRKISGTLIHKQYYLFVFYGRIIAEISKKEKLKWVVSWSLAAS